MNDAAVSFSERLSDLADEQRSDIKALLAENKKLRKALEVIAFNGFAASYCWAHAENALTVYNEALEIDPETGLDRAALEYQKRLSQGDQSDG